MRSNSKWSELMAQAQKGNSEMYNLLLTEISTYLQSYLMYKLRNAELVQDILQESLLSVHKSRHTYDSNYPFKPWLFKIVQSRLIDFYRKQGRQVDLQDLSEDGQLENISAEADISHLEVKEFNKALASLSDDQRSILCAIKLEGKSIKEVSQLMSLSEPAVKVTAHRAYKQLFAKLGVDL